MPTPRKPTAPTAEAIDQFCSAFDPLFPRREEREAFRHYLIGLLLPREHNKTVVELAALVPGAKPTGSNCITSCMMPRGMPRPSTASDYSCGMPIRIWVRMRQGCLSLMRRAIPSAGIASS